MSIGLTEFRLSAVLFLVAMLGVASCRAEDAAPTSEGAAQVSTESGASLPSPTDLRELAQTAGVECRDPDKGLQCIAEDKSDPRSGDYFDVELRPGCGEDGLFAGVSRGDALLVDRLPPNDTVRRATLSRGQLVCVQAIAGVGQNASRYYVTSVPVGDVSGCSGNKLCEMYGDRPIQWHVPRDQSTCRLDSHGRPVGGCASGWIEGEALDIFSMGLRGEDGQ